MLPIEAWRIHYADGSEREGRGATPEGLPDGVVCVMAYHAPPYRTLFNNGDWYWWEGGGWQATGTGEWGTCLPKPHPDAIRSTTRLPDDVFDTIIASAYNAARP